MKRIEFIRLCWYHEANTSMNAQQAYRHCKQLARLQDEQFTPPSYRQVQHELQTEEVAA